MPAIVVVFPSKPEPKAALKICRVIFHNTNNDPQNFLLTMTAKMGTYDCAAEARKQRSALDCLGSAARRARRSVSGRYHRGRVLGGRTAEAQRQSFIGPSTR